jgi:hypothetical protein
MKKTNKIIAIFFLILSGITHAQDPEEGVGIGNSSPNTSSILDVTSTTQGMLIPRMTSLQRNSIASPAPSLLLYNTDNKVFNYNQSLDPALPSWKSFSPPYEEIKGIGGTSKITILTSLNTAVVPGMSFTPAVAGNYLAQFSAEYKLIPVNFTTLLKTKLDNLLLTLNNIGIDNMDNIMKPSYTSTAQLGTGAYVFPANSTLGPGVYYIDGAGSIPGKLTLQGTANDLFIIKIKDAFNTEIGANVVLQGGVLASNVFWIAGTAIGLGANTTLAGTLISRGTAVSIGAGSIVTGKIFTVFGAIDTNNNTITNTSPGLIDLGVLNSFAIFSSNGGLGNTAASNNITGDIGTDNGTILNYGNLNGSIFNSVAQNAIVTFSLYGNGNPIPSTVKTRNYAQKIVSINLQALVAIPASTSIEVRSKVDIGTLEITNRTFSIIKLK